MESKLVIIAETIVLIALFLLIFWQDRRIERLEAELAALRQELAEWALE